VLHRRVLRQPGAPWPVRVHRRGDGAAGVVPGGALGLGPAPARRAAAPDLPLRHRRLLRRGADGGLHAVDHPARVLWPRAGRVPRLSRGGSARGRRPDAAHRDGHPPGRAAVGVLLRVHAADGDGADEGVLVTIQLAAIGLPYIPGWDELRPFVAELWLVATVVAVLLTPFFVRRPNAACAVVTITGLTLALLSLVAVGAAAWSGGERFKPMLVTDAVAYFWKVLLLLFVIGIVLMWFST